MGLFVVQFLTGLSGAASLFLVASGLTLIFGVTRIVNFAHGSFYMLGAYLALSLIEALPVPRGTWGGAPFWAAMAAAALGVGLIGVLVETIVLKPIYKAPELFQLLATFGVILVVQDAALWTWGAEDRLGPRAPGLRGSIEVMGQRMPVYDLLLIAVCPVVLAGLLLLFRTTRWGILVRAATADRQMVAALGVDQRWLFTSVFFLGSCLAGLGGALQLPKGGADLAMDFGIVADMFVVTVIGGMGSIVGAFLAALLIGELRAFGVLFFPESTLILTFLIMAVVLVLRPQGLLGRAEPADAPGHDAEPVRPADRTWRIAVSVLLAALLALPMIADPFVLVLAIDVLVMALFAASLHAIMGPGGMVSFGHAAFFGGGAYAAALAVVHLGAPMTAALPAGVVGAALLAAVIGFFCVRLRGVYFAMLTLAFAQIAWSIVFQWTEVTGGDDGLLGIWPAAWAADRTRYYYLTLALVTAGIAFLRFAVFTPFGRGLRAGRDSPVRAEAIGIDVARRQWAAFVLAGAVAGLAGGLYVFAKGSVFPDEMAIPRSFDGLMMVLLGGVNTLSGPWVGAGVFTSLQDWLSRMPFWRLTLGCSIIALVILFPQGIAGFVRQRAHRHRDRGS
ncbi:MAG: ABC transporter permease [Geminicoccaceae bacterium]|nr:ABC transporter permease [Geminicoccaceae bacterium]